MKHCPLVAAVSKGADYSTRKAAARAAKKLAGIHLEEDEKLILLDSGSSIDAADVEEEFPEYADRIVQGHAKHRGASATTACGGVVENKGKVIVEAVLTDVKGHDHEFSIPFNHMKVQLPIMSLRNAVKRKNTAMIDEHGGYLQNRASGAQIPIYEHEGVYYLKIKVKRPSLPMPPPEPVFGRRGR